MKTYTVKKGDSLWRIASRIYGDGRLYKKIFEANRDKIKNERVIFPGQVFIIPEIIEKKAKEIDNKKLTIQGKKSDQLTIIISGVEFEGFTNFRLFQSMETLADGWNCSFGFDVDNEQVVNVLKPFQYNEALVYIGGELINNGILYNVTPALSATQRTIALQGFTPTADIIDSVATPPYEFSGKNLKQIASTILEPFELPVRFDVDPGPVFNRVTIDPFETVGNFLIKLAKQRGYLVSSNEKGEVIFWRATNEQPRYTLEEGSTQLLSIPNILYNGRGLFNTYTAISQTPGKPANTISDFDIEIPKTRKTAFRADDTTAGDIKNAATWKKNKSRTDSFIIQLPVSGWRDPVSNLWKKNTRLILKSKTAFVPNGINLLIKAVDFSMDTSGKKAILSVVPEYTI